jgi:hypothetical protein
MSRSERSDTFPRQTGMSDRAPSRSVDAMGNFLPSMFLCSRFQPREPAGPSLWNSGDQTMQLFFAHARRDFASAFRLKPRSRLSVRNPRIAERRKTLPRAMARRLNQRRPRQNLPLPDRS